MFLVINGGSAYQRYQRGFIKSANQGLIKIIPSFKVVGYDVVVNRRNP